MYSFCTTDDGEVVHPNAFTDVEIVENKDAETEHRHDREIP